jgi:hypothetical protein
MHFCWASSFAKKLWEENLGGIIAAWQSLEIKSVIHDVRSCSLLDIDRFKINEYSVEASKRHLELLCIDNPNSIYQPNYDTFRIARGDKNSIRVVIGEKSKLREFKYEWGQRNHRNIGILLGYPSCCAEFFDRICEKEKYIDPTWNIALNSVKLHFSDTYIDVALVPETNFLLHSLGLKCVPHIPCSFNCNKSIDLAGEFMRLGRKLGYIKEMNILVEILGSELIWSSLHGIAEIKNTLFKISTRTDATATKYTVKLTSKNSPRPFTSKTRSDQSSS